MRVDVNSGRKFVNWRNLPLKFLIQYPSSSRVYKIPLTFTRAGRDGVGVKKRGRIIWFALELTPSGRVISNQPLSS